MPSEKRQRQRENRQLKVEQEEKAERSDQFRQYGFMAAIIAVALIGGLALLAYTSGDDEPDTEAAEAQADDTAESDDAAADTADVSSEPLPCPAEDGSSARTLEFPASPPVCIDESATYIATFDTNLGTIVAELDASQAPQTVNNFVYLARYHYYDDTVFHRIIDDFVIQGGDPVGDVPGTGNPGYFIEEEAPDAGEYQVGSLAMAKQTAPGTTGAQFFIITGAQGEALPNQYSLFGQVTEGIDVVQAISDLPTDDRDFPTEDIIVSAISITEG